MNEPNDAPCCNVSIVRQGVVPETAPADMALAQRCLAAPGVVPFGPEFVHR